MSTTPRRRQSRGYSDSTHTSTHTSTHASTHTRRRKPSKASKLLIALFFCLIVPAILGLIALTKSTFAEPPEETTAKFIQKHADQYLHVVTEKFNMYKELSDYGDAMTDQAPTGSLSDDQVFDILGLDANNSKIKDGKLKTTLTSGQTMSISNKRVIVDNTCYFKVHDDGRIHKVFDGYNSQTESNLSIAGEKRTMEELATIAMIADSVEEIGADYNNSNIYGSTSGIWWRVFGIYLVGMLVILLRVKLRKKTD